MKKLFTYNTVTILFLSSLLIGYGAQSRHEPRLTPRFVTDYHEDSVYKNLKRLRVKLETREFEKLVNCPMRTEGTLGPKFEFFPFKAIVEREFEEFISTNFYNAGQAGVAAKLVLEVVPLNYAIERDDSDDITCDMEFSINLSAPKTDFPPKQFICRSEPTIYHDIEGLVPCSLYAATQRIVKDFIHKLSGDPNVMTHLLDLVYGEDFKVEEPFTYSLGEELHYRSHSEYTKAYGGTANVKCNDSERDDVEEWAKERIKKVRGELYFMGSPYCVFFSPSSYDQGRLYLRYDIVARHDFIMISNGINGQSGRCFIDCASLKIGLGETARECETAKEQMKEFLKNWVEDHGDSAADVVLKNFGKDRDNPGFCRAEYEIIR